MSCHGNSVNLKMHSVDGYNCSGFYVVMLYKIQQILPRQVKPDVNMSSVLKPFFYKINLFP